MLTGNVIAEAAVTRLAVCRLCGAIAYVRVEGDVAGGTGEARIEECSARHG